MSWATGSMRRSTPLTTSHTCDCVVDDANGGLTVYQAKHFSKKP
jgi:hypothetical protein